MSDEPHDSDEAPLGGSNASPDSPAPSGDDSTRAIDPSAPPPVLIGDYRIVRKIGEGGMGVVYEAEQQHPKRLVALKVIRGGRFVDEYQVKLFEREAQALARLKHPSIAAIYESGRTPDGQHFFAMELVRGETLKEYLDKTGPQPQTVAQLRERLAIFRKVADAVTYAHQRGVIHRDLKPSNIVVRRDLESPDLDAGSPVPGIKILDFGLARITETDVAVTTVTEIGKIEGTLPYMSPEQVRGNPDEIDVRSDVYSLGVILYEMLTGRRPYDLGHAMLAEAVRVICEEPPVPLTRSWSSTTLRLDRDLGTIVGKALEKAPSVRYQSVSVLGDDIGRFLAGQPIQARPPSTVYQLRKLMARHKVGVGFAAAVVVLLVAFAVGMSIQARRIARERDRANSEARTAEQVVQFLEGMFQVSDPWAGQGKDVTARAVLDRGSQRIATELRDQPQVRARLMGTMASVYYSLGLYDTAASLGQDALTLTERNYAPDSVYTADAQSTLGAVKLEKADFAAAESLFRQALATRRSRLGPNHELVAECLNNLGSLKMATGDWKASEQFLRDALAIHRKVFASDDPRLAVSLNNVAIALSRQEKFAESEALYRESLGIRRKAYGNDHPWVANSLNNIGMLYVRQKKDVDAQPLLEEALAINRKAFGDVHPEVASNLSNLALTYLNLNMLPEAEERYRQVVELDKKTLGERNPRVAQPIQSLGTVLTAEKKFAEAEEAYRQALALKLTTFPADHWEVATTKNLMGACLMEQGKYAQAEALFYESLPIIEKQFGPTHDRTRVARTRLMTLYERWGKPEKAAEVRASLPAAK